MSDTRDRLESLLRDRFGELPELNDASELVADLDLDSIQQLELVVEIENQLAVELELEEGQEVVTVGDLVAWVERCRKQGRRDD